MPVDRHSYANTLDDQANFFPVIRTRLVLSGAEMHAREGLSV